MDDDQGPWGKEGWLRKMAALVVGGLMVSSLLVTVGLYLLCLPACLAIAFVGLVIFLSGQKRGPGDREGRGARGRRHGTRDVTPGAGANRGGDEGDVPDAGRLEARSGRAKGGGKEKRRRRVLRCPQCGSHRLVYEAGYVVGQYYLCKDCQYRGSFVLDMDPVDTTAEDVGVGGGEGGAPEDSHR